MLNTSQINGINELTNFLENSDDKYFLLTGEAGTGKSYLIKYFIDHCLTPNEVLFKILAPTNKALDVLNQFMPEYKHNTMTIAKYYNYKQIITDEGIKKSEYKLNDKKESVLIFDEASMINLDIFECLYNQNCKIIFIGDCNQLPPVDENISKIYDIPNIKTFNLTINERQKEADKELITFINKMRSNVDLNNFNYDEPNNFLTNDKNEFMAKAIEKMKEDDSTVILSYTRAKAEYYNKQIRSAIFNKSVEELDKFYLNEYVVFTESVFINKRNFSSGIKYQITHLKQVSLFVNLPSCVCKKQNEFISKTFNDTKKEKCISCNTPTSLTGMKIIKFYEIKLNGERDVYYVPYDDDEMEKYKTIMKKYKERCIAQKNSKTWGLFYHINEIYNLPISYRYALTIHKSQGSSYLNTFVDIFNINKTCIDNLKLKNQLIYTGVSRTKEYLLCLI